MKGDAVGWFVFRYLVLVLSACVCLFCPLAIYRLAEEYGDGPLPLDDPQRGWAGMAVEVLFWVALCATISLIISARNWWPLAALVSLPLLILTGILAVTTEMWIDGTYF